MDILDILDILGILDIPDIHICLLPTLLHHNNDSRHARMRSKCTNAIDPTPKSRLYAVSTVSAVAGMNTPVWLTLII